MNGNEHPMEKFLVGQDGDPVSQLVIRVFYAGLQLLRRDPNMTLEEEMEFFNRVDAITKCSPIGLLKAGKVEAAIEVAQRYYWT